MSSPPSKRRWCSGNIQDSHSRASGSIPGRRNVLTLVYQIKKARFSSGFFHIFAFQTVKARSSHHEFFAKLYGSVDPDRRKRDAHIARVNTPTNAHSPQREAEKVDANRNEQHIPATHPLKVPPIVVPSVPSPSIYPDSAPKHAPSPPNGFLQANLQNYFGSAPWSGERNEKGVSGGATPFPPHPLPPSHPGLMGGFPFRLGGADFPFPGGLAAFRE